MFWRPGAAARYQRAVQPMLEQEPLGRPPGEARGRIVNLSSQHGMISAPNDIAYGVSKAGCAYINRLRFGSHPAMATHTSAPMHRSIHKQ